MLVLFGKMLSLLAPEDAGGGGVAAPTAEPSETPSPAVPAEGAAPVVQTPAAPDPMARMAEMEQKLDAWQGWYQKAHAEQQKADREFKDGLLRVIAPEVVQQRQQPRYMTEEQFEARLQQVSQEQRNELIRRQFDGELSQAKAKHAEIIDYVGEDAIRLAWAKSKTGESVGQIAERYQKELDKRIAAHTAKLAETKTQTQQVIKGDGGAGRPAPASNGQDHGFRGRARLVALRKGSI